MLGAVMLLDIGSVLARPETQSLLDAFTVTSYGREDGLPETAVHAVEQTPDGFIWCLTPNHLLRFDGVAFARSGGLESGPIQDPYPILYRGWARGPDDTPWVFGQRGSARRTNEGWQRMQGEFPWQTVLALLPEGDGFRAVTAEGILKIDGDRQVAIPALAKPGQGLKITAAAAADDGALMLGTSAGLFLYRDARYEQVEVAGVASIGEVFSLHRGRSGDWWVCCRNGLLRKQGEAWERIETPFLPGLATSLLEDAQGAVWVGTKQGLFRHHEGRWSQLSPHDAAGTLGVLSLAQDRENRLWVGTVDGLLCLRPRLVEVFFATPRVGRQPISSLTVDGRSNLWVGSWSDGLLRLASGKLVPAENAELPKGASITALWPARDGGLWVGTLGDKLHHYDPRSGLTQFGEVAKSRQNAREISAILVSEPDQVWAGTPQGLFRMSHPPADTTQVNQLKPVPVKSTTGSAIVPFVNRVTALNADPDGSLWVGYDGLSVLRFDANPEKGVFGYGWGLPAASTVRTFYRDRSGRLWAGTSEGLGLLASPEWQRILEESGQFEGDPEQRARKHDEWLKTPGRKMLWQKLTEPQGLVDGDIRQITEDDQGRMWLGTRKGLQVFSRADLLAVMDDGKTFAEGRVIGMAEGMASEECTLRSSPGVAADKTGRLWFATTDGVACVDPAIVRPPDNPPAVYIDSVLADGIALYQRSGPSPLTLPATANSPAGDPVLTAVGRDLAFSFTSPVLDTPARALFRWRLDGVDSEWSAPSNDREVRYPRLRPGDYAFRLMSGGQGVWHEMAAPFQFRIRPHFYEVPGVQVAAGLMLAAALAFGIRRWERRRTFRRIQRIKQEGALDRERARISRDLHDEMGVGLTEIGLLGDLAGTGSPAQEGHKELAGEISTRARGLVAALDEIVWAINPANDNTLSLGDYFSRYAQTLLQRAGLRCRLEVANDSLDAGINAEQRHHLFLSFKEALNNVITHAKATEVRIRIGTEHGVLTIAVADNGHGFESPGTTGSPDGLRGMRERLANIGGLFEIQSAPDSGTTVTLSLPIKTPSRP